MEVIVTTVHPTKFLGQHKTNADLSHRVGLTGSAADPCNSGHRQTRQKWRPADGLVIGERGKGLLIPKSLDWSQNLKTFPHISPHFSRFQEILALLP